ncbi:MAG: hypothetical protein H7256_01320 [Bdellovibrio sp.]|nr:hypothetical protein [Bdellovibrio sp.]
MNWIFYSILSISLGFFASAEAQVYRLKSSYNVRSSPHFTSKASDANDNILGTLNPGSKIKVLETKILRPSGVEAFRVEILETKSKVKSSSADEIWIRKSVNKDYVTTESGNSCETCGEKAINLSPSSEQNVSDLKSAAGQMKEFSADVIEHDPGTNRKTSSKTVADDSLEQRIKNYSVSSEVEKMIKAGKRKGAKSFAKCYRSVKEMLVHGGLLKKRFSSLAARYAKNDLQEFGFINLLATEPYASQITSPSLAPKGSVLVYSSGIACGGRGHSYEKDCGHVEVKLGEPGQPGYASDYKSNDAINETSASKRFGSKYKLIGVMVKPMDNE